MKILLSIITLIALATTATTADTKVKAGPRHGRVLEMDGKNAEFFVEKDRTVSIAFYDAAMNATPATVEVVTATAEAPAGKAMLQFEKKGNLLVSKAPLPAGEKYLVVVQVKANAEAKPKNFRIELLLFKCKECGNAEYACICDH